MLSYDFLAKTDSIELVFMKAYKLDSKAMEQVQLKISEMKNDGNIDAPNNPSLEEIPDKHSHSINRNC